MLKPWIWLCSAIMLLSLAEAPVNSAPGPTPRQVYEAQCSFCHSPKPAQALPDLKAWIRLLYTSGCPQVTVKLAETQRHAIKAFMEAELKPPAPKKP